MELTNSLENELKELIVTTLRLEDIRPQDIDSDQPLFNDGLGLDSIDGLELGIAISKTYKIELSRDPEENKQYFANVRNLGLFIRQKIIEKDEKSNGDM
jgi:acyl carrier protein